MSQSGECIEANNKLGRAVNLKLGTSALALKGQSTDSEASGCAKCQPTRAVECVAESLILDGDLASRLVVEVQILVSKREACNSSQRFPEMCKFRCSILLKYRCTAGIAESLQVLCRGTPVFCVQNVRIGPLRSTST